jgi:hypothetical protein
MDKLILTDEEKVIDISTENNLEDNNLPCGKIANKYYVYIDYTKDLIPFDSYFKIKS